MNKKGFTLIELVVVIAIIAVLSGIILATVTQYIDRGKDSNVSGNLAVLIPAGEQYYDIGNTYAGFCDPNASGGINVFKNSISQMPKNPKGDCIDLLDPNAITLTANPAGVCCFASVGAWAACAQEFANSENAFCVDSRGVREEMDNEGCSKLSPITQCP